MMCATKGFQPLLLDATHVLDFVPVDSIGLACAECSDQENSPWHISPDNRLLCDECFSDEYAECCDCQKVFECDDMTPCGGGMLCENCLENYSTCDRCDSLTLDDECTEVDGNSWCRDCRRNYATRCDCCDEYTRDDNTIGTNSGSICESCYQDSYFTCDECNEVCHNDEYSEEGRCQSCSPDQDSIMGYSTDVCEVLNARVPRGKIYYGIELEVQASNGDRESTAYDCRESLGENYCINKEDCSTGANGFEIVTVPKPLERHVKIWSEFLDSPPRGLRSWDTSGKCGMHVHVSRKPLSQLTIGKILVFVNANVNKSFIVSIAGRENPCYAPLSPKKLTDGNKCLDRGAINIANSDTIEFRIFRGTLRKTSFLKNLEFVDATVRFCRLAGINGLDVQSFLAWFKPVRKDYPNLDAWLVSRNYLPSRSKPNKKASV